MTQKIKTAVLVFAFAFASFTPNLVNAQVPLADQLKAQYNMVKMGADSSGTAVVEAGTLLAIKKGGSQPPVREEFPALFGISEKDSRDLLKLLAEEGRTIRINDSLHLNKEVVDAIRSDLKKYLEEKKEITMAEFRDIAKTSRKFAVPLMEYFDSQKLTQRVGDKRVLRG